MDRFEDLAGDYFDGTLGDQDASELATILRQDPRRKQIFIDLIQQHRLLQVDLESMSEGELVGKIMAEIEGGDTGQFVNSVMKTLETPSARARPAARLRSTVPKRSSWSLRALTAAAAALVAWVGYSVFSPAAPESPRITATVVNVVGQVTTSDGNVARVGEELSAGQTLSTKGPSSSATVAYPDHTRIGLGGDSSLRFQPDAGASSGKVLLLLRGLLRGEVARQPPGLALRVLSRFAEARVLGTKFSFWADLDSTRLEVEEGKVRFLREGDRGRQGVEVGPGEKAAASSQDLVRWIPVCDLDFSQLKGLPPEMEAVFCSSKVLHTPDRKIENGADRIRFEKGGLIFDPAPGPNRDHGLVVARWKEDIGDDVVIEARVAAGPPWSLGFALSGDSFEGYRVIFAVREHPGGIMIDTIAPVDFKPLASDPRPILFDQDHLLRAERRGNRIRVWLDAELRLDADIEHPLPSIRKRTFALSNYGESPVVRSLRVWKAGSEK